MTATLATLATLRPAPHPTEARQRLAAAIDRLAAAQARVDRIAAAQAKAAALSHDKFLEIEAAEAALAEARLTEPRRLVSQLLGDDPTAGPSAADRRPHAERRQGGPRSPHRRTRNADRRAPGGRFQPWLRPPKPRRGRRRRASRLAGRGRSAGRIRGDAGAVRHAARRRSDGLPQRIPRRIDRPPTRSPGPAVDGCGRPGARSSPRGKPRSWRCNRTPPPRSPATTPTRRTPPDAPTHTATRRPRWPRRYRNLAADLAIGHIRSHLGETVRFDLAARQAGQWPEIGEEVMYSYATCPKTGDQIATGLRLTGPRRSPLPPAPRQRGFFA